MHVRLAWINVFAPESGGARLHGGISAGEQCMYICTDRKALGECSGCRGGSLRQIAPTSSLTGQAIPAAWQ